MNDELAKLRAMVGWQTVVRRPAEKKYDPDQPRDPKGSSTGGQWSDGGSVSAAQAEEGTYSVESVPADARRRKELYKEWGKAHGDNDEPFWDTSGEDDPRYWFIRDSSGKLIAGATTVRRKARTDLLSIRSHSKGAGKALLDKIKDRNTFIGALSSNKEADAFYAREGFQRYEKPGFYNWLWKKPAVSKRYNPDQPRYPEGDPRGGQWAPENGILPSGEAEEDPWLSDPFADINDWKEAAVQGKAVDALKKRGYDVTSRGHVEAKDASEAKKLRAMFPVSNTVKNPPHMQQHHPFTVIINWTSKRNRSVLHDLLLEDYRSIYPEKSKAGIS